jgi:hypothetical protein
LDLNKFHHAQLQLPKNHMMEITEATQASVRRNERPASCLFINPCRFSEITWLPLRDAQPEYSRLLITGDVIDFRGPDR